MTEIISFSDLSKNTLYAIIIGFYRKFISILYNNQINVHALIGQSAVGYCASKPTEKSRVFWIII